MRMKAVVRHHYGAPEILERVASEFGGEGAPVRLEIRVRG